MQDKSVIVFEDNLKALLPKGGLLLPDFDRDKVFRVVISMRYQLFL